MKGFAVGRTIFGEAARKWLSGTVGDRQAVEEMAQRYRSLCSVWDKARQGSGALGEKA
ncbi:hypothetical protein D3C72_2391560 [compost metagenome]